MQKKNYVPPAQGWFGQVFDSLFILVLVFASLLAPLLMKPEAAKEAVAAEASKVSWESLHLPAVEQAQWVKLGYTPEKAAPILSSKFDYAIDWTALAITGLVIVGYFTFMLKVSEKEYREVINEKFGRKPADEQGEPS
jgi:succinate dehydrogenase hydrophobic anchor subunit